jgi:bifunctional non-homologous end joining protein LigD
MAGTLHDYQRMRDFGRTPEPRGGVSPKADELRFVVQKHAARRLHYDFRLELDGALKSWAVPRGPSLDPKDKRLAVHVEDHPLEYAQFEGVIPPKQYGAGKVLVWDEGIWTPRGDPALGYRNGNLKFELEGHKLRGGWSLVRMADQKNWLLIKERDAAARSGGAADIVGQRAESVKTGRTINEVSDTPPASAKPSERKPTWPAGAVETPMPSAIKPQLTTLVERAPTAGRWLFELKYDGYRILSRVQNKTAHCYTRNALDWTDKLAEQARAVAQLPVREAWLDGELVIVLDDGKTDFQALQNAFEHNRSVPMTYFVFDLLYLDGHDLRGAPLLERKRLLADLLKKSKSTVLRYSEHIVGQGVDLHAHACQHGLEGIIGKRADAVYTGARTSDWIKLKCRRRQEFVIVGYTDPKRSRTGFGALLLGIHENDRLRYAGRVGSGFDDELLRDITKKLKALEQPRPVVVDPERVTGKDVHWVKPTLVAEVNFAEWTDDGVLRQASFVGLRVDKAARQIVKERASDVTAPSAVAGVTLSHPDRILYPNEGLTKLDVARYYESVAPWILPHLRERPLTLVRCPRGQEQECFFQKHINETLPKNVKRVDIEQSDGGVEPYMIANDIGAVIGLVQLGVLEFHTWGATRTNLKAPDRMIFDLDPDPELPWSRVVEAARLTRELLAEVGLISFLKTTGGKGLHVVVPLARSQTWDEVKGFSRAIAQHMAATIPQRFTANMSKSSRGRKIFIDYLRNGEGATAVAAFSTRARSGAPISMPLHWDELSADVRSDQFNVLNVHKRLEGLRSDPWQEYPRHKQRITTEMKRAFKMVK